MEKNEFDHTIYIVTNSTTTTSTMKLSQWIIFAYLTVTTYANVTIDKCMFCKNAVKQAEEVVATSGCNFWFKTKAKMYCMSADLDPDLTDRCVPLLIKGCNLIQENMKQNSMSDPLEICTSLEMC